MSHLPLRKEQDCLNCGAMLEGRYCHICGQENVVPKETFWHMVTHFFYDITHFDSKFFLTIKDLVFKPGFLSKEYMQGRRASYLHPVKMYVFTSAVFFLLFFSFFGPKTTITISPDQPISAQERADFIEKLQTKLVKDTGNAKLKQDLAWAIDTSHMMTERDLFEKEDTMVLQLSERSYKTVEEYDSIEQTLPQKERDGWIMRRIIKKSIAINNKFRAQPEEALKKLMSSLLHKLPYMLFISLPLFALILQLVYLRRKQFYYADHGVFTIHLYIFSFLILLLVFILSALEDLTQWKLIPFVVAALIIILFFYLYKAMRNFYGQRRGKTFIKFLFVAFSSLIMMLLLLAFFFFFSAFTL